MKIYESSDFQKLLEALPNIAGNEPVAMALSQMAAEQKTIRQPYTFEVDFTAANVNFPGAYVVPAAGASAIGSFLVDSSAPFMLVSTQYAADVAAAAKTVSALPSPNFSVTIADQSSNRNWMNGPVPVPSIFGSGNQPYFWPQPRLIPANSTILITLFNYDAAQATNIRLSFSGWRYYGVGQ